MKKLLSVIMAGLLVLLASCSGENSSNKITIVLDWIPNTNHTGFYIAEKLGYFEKEGLDVEIVQPPEDGAAAMVASGQAQFGIGFQDTLAPALASENPLPITAVATIIQHNTSGIVSLKEKGIESPKDMEGMRYATWSIPIEQGILRNVVETDGGIFDNVELIPSTVDDVFTALTTDIDCVWIYYGWDGAALEVKDVDVNYFEFRDINPVMDYYTPVILSNDTYLKENPETTKKFLKACKNGYEYAIDNPTEAAEILCELVPEIDLDIAKASQKYLAGQYKAEVEQWGYIEPDRWNAFYGWLYDNELVESDITGKGFTNGYLPE